MGNATTDVKAGCPDTIDVGGFLGGLDPRAQCDWEGDIQQAIDHWQASGCTYGEIAERLEEWFHSLPAAQQESRFATVYAVTRQTLYAGRLITPQAIELPIGAPVQQPL